MKDRDTEGSAPDNAFTQAESLTELIPAPREAAESEPKLDYQGRVDRLFGYIESRRADGVWQAREEAWEKYVNDEEDLNLRDFSAVMLRGAYDNSSEDLISGHQRRIADVTLPSEERQQLRHEVKEAKYQRVESQHLLRQVLQAQGDNFTKKEFVAWYTRALQGRSQTAEGTVTGAAAEIATYEAMATMSDFSQVRYGEPHEDLKGADIIGYTHGKKITVDVKAGKQMPTSSIEHGDIHLVIGVIPGLIDEHFRTSESSREGMQKLIQLALAQSRIGQGQHRRSA